VNGEEKETSKAVTPWGGKYLTLKLDQPAKGTEGGTYRPNDMSVGDVDGDGEYELFVKWDPTTSHDNSEDGFTDIVYIDCYKLDGTKLWRVDLGKNIRAGAHYTQFMVYDFDGDGKAEMMCKTASGSKDGKGYYVNQAATDTTIKGHDNQADYRVGESASHPGHVLSGPEYLTVFNGATGEAMHTTWYLPGRAGTGKQLPSGKNATEGGSELGKVSSFPSGFWGDNYGGRSERYLAAVAYINGADQHPCAIFCRGYYTQAYVWAVSFDGTRLHTEWLHASPNGTQSVVFSPTGTTTVKIDVDGDVLVRGGLKTAAANTGGVDPTDGEQSAGSNTLFGNGNHNLSIADVDGDGCDEIIWGASALNNDGTLLYATGYGHGDAIHVGKMIPDSTDLYVFDVHEEKLKAAHGSWDLHNARTGRIVHHGGPAESDNGRGMAAALSTSYRGYEFWSSDDRQPRLASTGNTVINKSCSVNFRIYWDGTYVDQLFDGSYDKDNGKASPFIQKWNGSSFTNVISFGSSTYNNPQTCNTTKATPCLQADILGDWREELVMWNYNDPSQIMIFTTWTTTNYMVPTLMHDHVYRMGVAWQNTAYNQPPHLGYYLPDYIEGKLPSAISQTSAQTVQKTETFDLQGRRTTGLKKGLNIIRVQTINGVETRKVIY
jgi:rhamnogalacturonan endolyase